MSFTGVAVHVLQKSDIKQIGHFVICDYSNIWNEMYEMLTSQIIYCIW